MRTKDKKHDRYPNDTAMRELLCCNGNVICILNTLSRLSLYACDFTLKEIGRIMKITRERVRQIESSAIKKLKHPKNGRVLKKYFEI